MNRNDNINIEEKIYKEYKENEIKMDEIRDKIWYLERSQFETKLIGSFGMSIIFWLIPLFFSMPILKSGLIPFELAKPLFVLVPAILGTLTTSIIMKKQKIDKNVKGFSTATTEKEKIEEEVKYKIELIKLKNYNQALHNSLNIFDPNNELVKLVSNKNTDLSNKEDISKNIIKEKELIKQNEKSVNIKTTKYVLANRFWPIRDKFNRVFMPFMFGAFGAICFMMVYNVPMIQSLSIEGIEDTSGLLNTFVPSIIGAVLCTGYGLKRNRYRLSVYNKLNDELGEDKIGDDEKTYDDELAFELEMKEAINNSCHLNIMHYIDTKKLENLKAESENIIEENYQAYTLVSQPKGEIKDYYLEGEFEHKSDEVLERELPGEEQVKVRRLTNK